MIPGLLAQDVAQSLREFIVTGFETDTWPFAGKFEELVNSYNNGEAFIKGPYVSISLPFAKNTDRRDFFNSFASLTIALLVVEPTSNTSPCGVQ